MVKSVDFAGHMKRAEVSTYTIPARAGGKMMEAVGATLMRIIFRAILAGCAKALER
jgi:hypothetical protein